jgi:hypothetical protein
MELRTLSSVQTFTAKVIFPVIWISGFGLGTLMMWLQPARTNTAAPELPKLQFLIGWIIGTLFLLLGPGRLKRVRADARNIYVSNYIREVTIPLANIRDVTENRLMNWHPVKVHFGEPTSFGTTIVFMPKIRWFGLWALTQSSRSSKSYPTCPRLNDSDAQICD